MSDECVPRPRPASPYGGWDAVGRSRGPQVTDCVRTQSDAVGRTFDGQGDTA
jgi:hypothetical protein